MLSKRLKNKSREIRIDILNSIFRSGAGHIGGSFSCVEILISIFFNQLKLDPINLNSPDRDRFILCKGHAAVALYVILSHLNIIDKLELNTICKLGSRLQGHPDMHKTPGIEISTGSLGQGLSVACGLAYSSKYLLWNKFRVYALLGDGELNEGQVWEAALFASHHKLDNLVGIIDRNRFQYTGKTDNILSLNNLIDKWSAFGWKTYEVDGHDLDQINNAFRNAECFKDIPQIIVANTIKGKGVSFMENNNEWHGRIPDSKQYDDALKELKK